MYKDQSILFCFFGFFIILFAAYRAKALALENTPQNSLSFSKEKIKEKTGKSYPAPSSTEEGLIELKRTPKLGFTFPIQAIPWFGIMNDGGGHSYSFFGHGNNGNGTSDKDKGPFSALATLGSSALLINGGILGTLAALKAVIIPPLFLGALIIFLVAGAAYFTCSIFECGRIFGGGINSHSHHSFDRNSYQDYPDPSTYPIYQAISGGDNFQKYGQNN